MNASISDLAAEYSEVDPAGQFAVSIPNECEACSRLVRRSAPLTRAAVPARARNRGQSAELDSNRTRTYSLRCARPVGSDPTPALSLVRYAHSLDARGRIRTDGPLRDSVLSAAPLAWLGYPQDVQ